MSAESLACELKRAKTIVDAKQTVKELAAIKTYGEMAQYLAENMSMEALIRLEREVLNEHPINDELYVTYEEALRIQREELNTFRII